MRVGTCPSMSAEWCPVCLIPHGILHLNSLWKFVTVIRPYNSFLSFRLQLQCYIFSKSPDHCHPKKNIYSFLQDIVSLNTAFHPLYEWRFSISHSSLDHVLQTTVQMSLFILFLAFIPSLTQCVCLKIGFTVARHQSKGYLQMISKEYIPEEGEMREQGRADKRRDQPRYPFRWCHSLSLTHWEHWSPYLSQIKARELVPFRPVTGNESLLGHINPLGLPGLHLYKKNR